MATELREYLNNIVEEKNAKVIPTNIRKGITLYGVEGTLEEGIDTTDATAVASNILQGETAYVNDTKIEGTMANNAELTYSPSDEEQEIPEGYTTGGKVEATDITRLNEYQACLTLANSIENLEDFSDTTATAEDILKGKTAYSNGEKLVGTFIDKDCLTFINNITTLNFMDIVESVDLSNVDLTNCTSFYPSFGGYKNLKSVVGLNAPKCNSIGYVFNDCSSLEVMPIMNIAPNCSASYAFQNCYNLVDISNWANISPNNTTYTFRNCYNITSYPICNHDYDDRCYGMFYGCRSLVDVPFFNTALIYGDGMKDMFFGCQSLSDESLNNILAMCVNAVKISSSNRTLKYIGLTQEQATRCTTLSNYATFTAAGLTTGY